MKTKHLLRAIGLSILLVLLVQAANAGARASTALPPVDMFQLPWEQGRSWVAIDGLDNGTNRPLNSSHNYLNGGAIDFAPHNNMIAGEDTSNAWVVAAAAGTVIEISSCDVTIDHNGWITGYQFIGNLQVKLGDTVSRNQRLGVVADGIRLKFCPPTVDPDVPHLHFTLRPSIRNATLSGWMVNYGPISNVTTFTKDGQTLGLFKPLSNVFSVSTDPSVSTVVNPGSIIVGDTAVVTVSLNNIPTGGYTSAEFTCTYDASLGEVSNISATSLFGTDSVVAVNGPQNGSFIVAVAGSNGNKATTSGAAFTFSIKGLQTGQTTVDCKARISKGDNVLTSILSTTGSLTIIGSAPTATPTPTPVVSVTPTAITSVTPTSSPTPTPLPAGVGALTGQVTASKPVGVNLYDANNTVVASVAANADGTFSLTAPAGTYTAVATAAGFLSVQGSVTLSNGATSTLPTISLLAGDIDNNNVIDQLDAITIGMNYNLAVPAAADLNSDGVIDVLDLELLAHNYRKTGPLAWQ